MCSPSNHQAGRTKVSNWRDRRFYIKPYRFTRSDITHTITAYRTLFTSTQVIIHSVQTWLRAGLTRRRTQWPPRGRIYLPAHFQESLRDRVIAQRAALYRPHRFAMSHLILFLFSVPDFQAHFFGFYAVERR
jgi:hypothetical protein